MLGESKPPGKFICTARSFRIGCAQLFSNYLLFFFSFFKVFVNFVPVIEIESQGAEDFCQSQDGEAFFLNSLRRQTFTPPINNRVERYSFSSDPINAIAILDIWIIQFYLYVTHARSPNCFDI